MLSPSTLIWPVILAAAGFVVTFATIPSLSRLASRYGLVDRPNVRKIHVSATPLCGGIAIFIPVCVTLFVLVGLHWFKGTALGPNPFQLVSLFVALAWILCLGIIDDLRQISWKHKLLGQIVGILILIIGGHSVRSASVPLLGPVDFGLAGPLVFGLAVLVVMNAVNLIDGLDGLAGGICLFAAIVYGIVGLHRGDLFASTVGFVLSGSLLGFLPFNWPPAKVFLGDAGSLMLGFLLGTLATSYASTISPGQRAATFWVMVAPFLPFTIALLDEVLAVARRWARGGRIFFPDSDHIHHRLLSEFKRPAFAVGIIYVISSLFAALSLIVTLGFHSWGSSAFLSLIVISVVGVGTLLLRSYRVEHLPQATRGIFEGLVSIGKSGISAGFNSQTKCYLV